MITIIALKIIICFSKINMNPVLTKSCSSQSHKTLAASVTDHRAKQLDRQNKDDKKDI